MKLTKTERDAQMQKLFLAGRDLLAWRDAHQLTDDDVEDVLAAVGWTQLVAGRQQSRAGSVTSERKAAAVRENGRKGGRPKKV